MYNFFYKGKGNWLANQHPPDPPKKCPPGVEAYVLLPPTPTAQIWTDDKKIKHFFLKNPT